MPKHSGEYLLEVVMRRYENRSTIMTGNRPLEEWGKLLGDVPTAGAILDRFLHHAQVIAITGEIDSTLARSADVSLDASVDEEACPHDLAPTTSTTVTLAIGDALAVALLEVKGFRREDFARLHPGGSLGRKLLTKVRDVMLTDKLPILPPTATMREAVVQLAERRGIVLIAEADRKLAGLLTTGDLTRLMEREEDFMRLRVDGVMVRSPKTAGADELGSAVVYLMEQHGIMCMPVLRADGTIEGVVHLHDLMRAGAA